MLTAIGGVRVGHWSDHRARTGCTVVLLPPGTTASAEVRGGAPASRELALLEPGRTVEHLDAVLPPGGGAFGRAAADGVMRWCEAQGRGFPTGAGPVPIVAALALFDLLEGDATVRPGPAEGRAACDAAATAGEGATVALGRVGAGTGATVGKWRGRDHTRPGGIGAAVATDGDVVVAALFAVNAYGDAAGAPGELRLPDPLPDPAGAFSNTTSSGGGPFPNTTIGVVVTNAAATKFDCHRLAVGAHDGMARALEPVHTGVDGDAVVVAATGATRADPGRLRALVVSTAELAIRDGIARGVRP
ncbi:MAG: P1 family peptidase [Acidimicrobiales bacterium]